MLCVVVVCVCFCFVVFGEEEEGEGKGREALGHFLSLFIILFLLLLLLHFRESFETSQTFECGCSRVHSRSVCFRPLFFQTARVETRNCTRDALEIPLVRVVRALSTPLSEFCT